MDGSIVVTGATGWVGLSAIDELHQMLDPEEFNSRVKAFASRQSRLLLRSGTSLLVQPLDVLPELAAQEHISAILHTAFLTPDRLQELGTNKYVSVNRQITGFVVKALELSPSTRAVNISSGAAAIFENYLTGEDNSCLSDAQKLYGRLKLEEESALSSRACTLILRIYSLSGRWMRNHHMYALGQFLVQARAGDRILVKARHPVIRGFGNASDITRLALTWLLGTQEAPSIPVPACNVTLELVELASIISELYGLPAPEFVFNSDLSPDVYSCSMDSYNSFAKDNQIFLRPIAEQVSDTAKAFM